MVDYSFQPPPIDHPNAVEHRRQLALAIRRLFDGKLNTMGTVTLTASATSTTITNEKIGVRTIVMLFPTTANAAGEVGYYQTWPNASTGSAVINHANDSRSDRTFTYILLG